MKNNLRPDQQKMVKALQMSIEALERQRRARYTTGHHAYQSGIRASTLDVVIDGVKVQGVDFGWVEEDEKHYQEHTEAIQTLSDLIDIITDPPARAVA